MKLNATKAYLIIFFALVCTHIMAQSENDKRIELGKHVFTALQKNDAQLYRNLYPNFEEYKSLMQQMVNAKIDGLTQEQMNNFLEDYKQKSGSTYRVKNIRKYE